MTQVPAQRQAPTGSRNLLMRLLTEKQAYILNEKVTLCGRDSNANLLHWPQECSHYTTGAFKFEPTPSEYYMYDLMRLYVYATN